MKNKNCKEVPLNLNKAGTVHTNPNGRKIKVKKIGEEYFKLKKSKGSVGRGGMFPNHLESQGWLHFNNLASIDIEEIEEKWS